VHTGADQVLQHSDEALAIDRAIGMEGRDDRRDDTSKRHGETLAANSWEWSEAIEKLRSRAADIK